MMASGTRRRTTPQPAFVTCMMATMTDAPSAIDRKKYAAMSPADHARQASLDRP